MLERKKEKDKKGAGRRFDLYGISVENENGVDPITYKTLIAYPDMPKSDSQAQQQHIEHPLLFSFSSPTKHANSKHSHQNIIFQRIIPKTPTILYDFLEWGFPFDE